MAKTIHQIYTIKAQVTEVWKALTNPKYIDNWGGGPSKMDENIGTKFSLWGGDIHGKNIEVEKEKKLVQEWISGNWEKPSIATFILSENKTGTKLEFIHTGVPEKDFKDIEDGWKDYYLGPLKNYLEKNKS